MIDRLMRETSSSSSPSSHAMKTIPPNAYEKKHGIVERCTHSVDALRAATPSCVETLPSKTSLGRRRVVVVVEDEAAVETREAAARRNMCAHGIGSVRFGSVRFARDRGDRVELAGVASSFKALGPNFEAKLSLPLVDP